MPEYYLSDDLVRAALDALPPPPPDASVAWRGRAWRGTSRTSSGFIRRTRRRRAGGAGADQSRDGRQPGTSILCARADGRADVRLCRTSTELSRTAVLVERLLSDARMIRRGSSAVSRPTGSISMHWSGVGQWRRQAPPADGGVPEGDGAFAQADMVPGGVGPDGDGPDGDGPAGDGPAGVGPAGDGPAGDGPAGDGPAGMVQPEWSSGNDQDGNDQEGDGPGGDGDAASDNDLAAAGVSALDGGSDLEPDGLDAGVAGRRSWGVVARPGRALRDAVAVAGGGRCRGRTSGRS